MYYVVKCSNGLYYIAKNGVILDHSYGAFATAEAADRKTAQIELDLQEAESDRAAWYDQDH